MIVAMMLAGGVGSCCRYLVDTAMRTRFPDTFWGTIIVNVAGSFLLGLVLGWGHSELVLIVGTGFCGGFTTFSTAMVEHVRVLRTDTWRGIAWGIGLLALCLAAGALGLALSGPSIA
ncbi:MAG: fluoride efflux transporter FluC [Propionibacteriaceae bacterium]